MAAWHKKPTFTFYRYRLLAGCLLSVFVNVVSRVRVTFIDCYNGCHWIVAGCLLSVCVNVVSTILLLLVRLLSQLISVDSTVQFQ